MKSAVMGRAATDALVEYARPQQGMLVLDLASGTGEPGISLAGEVGPEGRVVAVDLSAELLEVARERAQQRGLSNFSTQQADAHALPFRDNAFNLATCRFGVMFFADAIKHWGKSTAYSSLEREPAFWRGAHLSSRTGQAPWVWS